MKENQNKTCGTFCNNMRLPVHRWYRYSAGFSANWVRSVIQEYKPNTVLDPFAGSGTTLLASEQESVKSYGYESHYFVTRIAQAKLSWNASISSLTLYAKKLLERAETITPDIFHEFSLVQKCFSETNLVQLCKLRESFELLQENIPPTVRNLLWLAITSILRPCSQVSTAQCQYILPSKTKTNILKPFEAFKHKIKIMIFDMQHFQRNVQPIGKLFVHDAREQLNILKDTIDLVITSPPYPNNYDYADSTRLEMSYWHEISRWSDLQFSIRRFLIHSCSQHTAAEKLELKYILESQQLKPIARELSEICYRLEKERKLHVGKKTYDTMVAAYFNDLASVFYALRYVCKRGSHLCFIVGDSAPYGVYVPVEEFMGRLALASGFKNYSFEKIRDRNVKWKNRIHTVPLKEGCLWIEG